MVPRRGGDGAYTISLTRPSSSGSTTSVIGRKIDGIGPPHYGAAYEPMGIWPAPGAENRFK